MTLQELQSIFPSLKSMSLDKNYAVLYMVNEYGLDEFKQAIKDALAQKEVDQLFTNNHSTEQQ